jgi:hypothetical protein
VIKDVGKPDIRLKYRAAEIYITASLSACKVDCDKYKDAEHRKLVTCV